ncbi:MAG: Acetyl-/propionyl-coenzyme A carboxylase alpha chain [Burkholderiaceae bacterium]|nr:Acetyl-/propionyl-coenzyme A carboxylase alpha chain [Burkholderiaceae bacterium]
MFRKVLIANRGEIARRIARTCRRMGLQVATVHSDADRDAPHVRDIGESVRLGPAAARESYLDIARVVQAARQVGADAVHPGYGFLSENADFADALQRAGIAFVGPSAQVLRDFGDKAAAKRLAAAAGVPTIPGSALASADAQRVAAMVHEVGFPALLKAAAGGGGKGIRILRDATELHDEIATAMREGRNAFGDAALLVERYLPHGRHVEVQIVGDGGGAVLHLWERECSLQRRHQKVVEEAPALPLPTGLRQRLLDAAVALGRHVRYRALGTVEFLVAGDAFHFLEVNPRLQVEHPVTECVTGLDLVELQIRAAAGEPLPLSQDDVRCDGHAIEARLYAEDPAHGFMPATGVLHRLRWPAGGVRVETGVEVSTEITPHYDPMAAKLIVHGNTRAEALAAMRAALAATQVVGVANNLGFLESLLGAPEVASGTPDTGTIDRLLPGLKQQPSPWRTAAAHVAAAWVMRRSRSMAASAPASAWPGFTNWRLGGSGQSLLQPQYEVLGEAGMQPATVTALDGVGARWRVRIGAQSHEIVFGAQSREVEFGAALDDDGDAPLAVAVDGSVVPLWIGAADARVWLGDGRVTETLAVQPALREERTRRAAAGAAVVAPLTGKVLEVRVREGDAVSEGQVLLVVESMKMELRICAPHAGVARALGVAAGAAVERGAVLVTVQPEEASA